jgi:uncharacterized protein YbjT (DUF2867 family)
MHVIVLGVTRGTGRATVHTLLQHGHTVTAFARDPAKVPAAPNLTVVQGDAMNSDDVARAVPGHDAVVVSLGISESGFRLALGLGTRPEGNVCEVGTRNVIAAMRQSGIARLVVVSSFGVGDSRGKLPLLFKLFYIIALREHMRDKEQMELLVKASGLDWTLVQPVGLDDKPGTGKALVTTDGAIRGNMVSRQDVADLILHLLTERSHVGESVVISG